MFDTETRRLIQNVPAVADFDADDLPEKLSRLFVQTVSLRLSLSSAANRLDDDLITELGELRELAMTYASFVASDVGKEHTTSAAYVAGTTFRILAEVASIGQTTRLVGTSFSADEVPDGICAIVLFLIAGYPADAMEVARVVRTTKLETSDSSELLKSSLCALAEANLPYVSEQSELAEQRRAAYFTQPTMTEQDRDAAAELLWLRLTEGVGTLADDLLHRREAAAENSASQIFEQVMALCSETLSFDTLGSDEFICSTFAGPSFLASLLRRLSDDLPERGVVNVGSPSGIDPLKWTSFVNALALSRPLLWGNHQAAIEKGFLDCGVSSVISFPTGAGKSTLAEMKIAPYVLKDQKVVFLAPTHALSHQVQASLKRTFPNHRVHDSVIGDGFYAELGNNESEFADITVMTPERCLMLLDLYRSSFRDVGLVVMDECHILHPSRGIEDRRAIDAMLALLRIFEAAADADIVLLSAMMNNTAELAGWISQAVGRKCLPLDLRWKPTRQAKGCLVYKSEDLKNLNADVMATRKTGKTKSPPVALKRRLKAQPIGLFSLRQTWNTQSVENFHFCDLLPISLPLGVNPEWSLTNDKNEVAAITAGQFATRRIKTIIFSQNKLHCESIAKSADEKLSAIDPVQLTSTEMKLRNAAIDEAGGEAHALLPLSNGVSCHHGLLTPVERVLAESVFRRDDGGRIIVATPTLAQGMNLPAEAVIIAGTHRFSEEDQRTSLMEAHDLLNAAGRSGRAGYRPEGIVLLITDSPIGFTTTEKSTEIGQAWFELKDSIFSKEDQCLSIQDPVQLMLDVISESGALQRGTPSYFVNRLPLADGTDEIPRLLSKSLGAFIARRNGTEQIFEMKTRSAIRRRRELLLSDGQVTWADRLASSNGVSAVVLQSIADEMPRAPQIDGWTVQDWIKFAFDWSARHPKLADRMFDRKATESVLGSTFLPKGQEFLDANSIRELARLFKRFINGETLVEIEKACPNAKPKPGFCHRARTLVQRISLDVSFLVGLFPQVYRELTQSTDGEKLQIPTNLAVASACARKGLGNSAQLAVAMQMRTLQSFPTEVTRRQIHNYYRDILPHLSDSHDDMEPFSAVSKRVKLAIVASTLTN